MHIEFLVEDSSGGRFLEHMLPKVLAGNDEVTWRVHSYRGIGRIPTNLSGSIDPAKRVILDQLPRVLKGYARTPSIDAVVVVVDVDSRDCSAFLAELKALAAQINSPKPTLFRLAIEEMEAWFFGDEEALRRAYPRARTNILRSYVQDSICGTWERLADALFPGGVERVREMGWPLSGELKHEWAEKITPLMDPDRNVSPSFLKFRDGVRALVG